MITIASVLEVGMMTCWGVSWPFQVAKTYTSKNVKGKSILFIWLIAIGYVFALIYKAFYHYDYVIWLYLLNLAFVIADMVLYYKYKRLNNCVELNEYKNNIFKKQRNKRRI